MELDIELVLYILVDFLYLMLTYHSFIFMMFFGSERILRSANVACLHSVCMLSSSSKGFLRVPKSSQICHKSFQEREEESLRELQGVHKKRYF